MTSSPSPSSSSSSPPRPRRPLRVAVLCSHHAPGLMYLLNRSPERGVAYEIVCVVTSEATFSEEVRVERRGVPTRAHPIRLFHAMHGAEVCDPEARRVYDNATASLIDIYLPDLILLDGYRYLISPSLLEAFPARVLNLAFCDLLHRRPDGGPRFTHATGVADAIAARCRETRATVHVVNERPLAGAPLVRSWAFPVSPLVEDLATQDAHDVVNTYAAAHAEWMIRTAAGPLMAAALRLVSRREVDLNELASMPPGEGPVWTLDRDGSILAPDLELVGA